MRSGSTSFYRHLLKVTGLKPITIKTLRERKKAEGVDEYMHYPSSTALVLPKEQLTHLVTSKEILIREHLLPVQAHRDILMAIPRPQRKVVVLKRDAQHSFNSQLKRSGECPYGSRGEYKTECRESFVKFREGIDTFFPEKDGFLHVEFDDLIKDSKGVVSKVLSYWGLDHNIVKLESYKFPHHK